MYAYHTERLLSGLKVLKEKKRKEKQKKEKKGAGLYKTEPAAAVKSLV